MSHLGMGTIFSLGLVYKANGSTECTGYSDADWATDTADNVRLLFLLGGAAISWKSNKQTCIALSTAEADLLNRSIQETIIFEDNQSAICLAKNQQTHGRTKHIYHFIRDLVETGRIKLAYCHSAAMVADIPTKGLPTQQFKKLRGMVDLKVVLAESKKEC